MSWTVIGVTMLVSFTLALGVMLWRERPAAIPAGIGMISPPRFAAAPRVQHDQPPADAARVVEAARAPAAISNSPAPSAEDLAPMPVKVWFRQPPPGDASARALPMAGRLLNESDSLLSIDLIITDPFTERILAKKHLEVDPKSKVTFGEDDGLQIHNSELLTLKSPPFADFQRRVY